MLTQSGTLRDRIELVEQGLAGNQLKLIVLPGIHNGQRDTTAQQDTYPDIGINDNAQHEKSRAVLAHSTYFSQDIIVRDFVNWRLPVQFSNQLS